jgi:hypothetical protein
VLDLEIGCHQGVAAHRVQDIGVVHPNLIGSSRPLMRAITKYNQHPTRVRERQLKAIRDGFEEWTPLPFP